MKRTTFLNGTTFRSLSLVALICVVNLFPWREAYATGLCGSMPNLAPATPLSDNNNSDAARYQQAREHINKGDTIKARQELEKIANDTFILGDYAAFDLASILVDDGWDEKALNILAGLSKDFPYSPMAKNANKLMLTVACNEPEKDICKKYLSRITDKQVEKSFKPQRAIMIANRHERMGQTLKAYTAYQKIYFDYPASSRALVAGESTKRIKRSLDKKTRAGYPHPTFDMRMQRVKRLMKKYRFDLAVIDLEKIAKIGYAKNRKAQVYLAMGEAKNKIKDRSGAKRALLKFMEQYPDHPKINKSSYDIAVIDWNLDNDNESVERLQGLLGSSASQKLKARASFVLGKIAESQFDYALATTHYNNAIHYGPGASDKREIAWRIGWAKYRQGQFSMAAKRFGEAVNNIPFSYRDGRFLYWQARSLELSGATAFANKIKAVLTRQFPHTYYGSKLSFLGKGAASSLSIDEMNSFYGQVESSFARMNLSNNGALHLLRFEALIKAKMYSQAAMEVGLLAKRAPKKANALLWLALQYRKANASSKSIRLLIKNVGKINHKFNFSGPFWRELYPVDHWEVALKKADYFGIDPFLVLSTIRQESAFDSNAHSSANARGLMQLMSGVAKLEFDKIGFRAATGIEFKDELLFDPCINISIGVAHLSSLLASYNGDEVFAIAAYNAGANAVNRWREKYPDVNEDEFIELIPYKETRGYVKRVLRNEFLYHRIYLNSRSTTPDVKAGALENKPKGS